MCLRDRAGVNVCVDTFRGIASRFLPVATVITALSGGLPSNDTLPTHTHKLQMEAHCLSVSVSERECVHV